MTEASQFLSSYGLPLVFAAVFLEQMGLPLPALPCLVGAGALAATGKFNLPLGLGVTVTACLAADAIWFYVGRYRGNQVLSLFCRVFFKSNSCVRRLQNVFEKYGLRSVLLAKFLPGSISTVAPPLAGMSGMSAGLFLLMDGAGSLLYGASSLGLGYLFSHQVGQISAGIARIGGVTLSLIIGAALLYVAYKYWQRKRYSCLNEVRAREQCCESRGTGSLKSGR
jgi:membrane protein DedA with SNARE-associated domain